MRGRLDQDGRREGGSERASEYIMDGWMDICSMLHYMYLLI